MPADTRLCFGLKAAAASWCFSHKEYLLSLMIQFSNGGAIAASIQPFKIYQVTKAMSQENRIRPSLVKSSLSSSPSTLIPTQVVGAVTCVWAIDDRRRNDSAAAIVLLTFTTKSERTASVCHAVTHTHTCTHTHSVLLWWLQTGT